MSLYWEGSCHASLRAYSLSPGAHLKMPDMVAQALIPVLGVRDRQISETHWPASRLIGECQVKKETLFKNNLDIRLDVVAHTCSASI